MSSTETAAAAQRSFCFSCLCEFKCGCAHILSVCLFRSIFEDMKKKEFAVMMRISLSIALFLNPSSQYSYTPTDGAQTVYKDLQMLNGGGHTV